MTKPEFQELWYREILEKELISDFIGKGSHNGAVKNVAPIMAATAHGKDLITAKQDNGRTYAEMCSSFLCENFATMFNKCQPKVETFPARW